MPPIAASPDFDIVIPTAGRASLAVLLDSLEAGEGPLPRRVVVAVDRDDAPVPADRPPGWLRERVVVVRAGGRGPAAARNAGWRACTSEWVAFLDDDVVPDRDWLRRLAADLSSAAPSTAAVQGRLAVPLPAGRRPTDWERNVGALENARWITADMAVRREALRLVGGFDERFLRAYREDADLSLRILGAGLRIVWGARRVSHPVRGAPWWVSLRVQAGNRDDVLMDELHGPDWREEGRRPRRLHAHLVTAAAGAVAALALALHFSLFALMAATAWLALTAQFTWTRVAPGPRTVREIAAMLVTSVLMPFVVAYHWGAAMVTVGRVARSAPAETTPAPEAALEAVE